MTETDDTIVAAATPPGAGGVAIVRLSGPHAETIARKILGRLPPPRIASYNTFRNQNGETIDAGIALYFPAPSSFTGDSVVELHGHGGPLVVSMLVEATVELGARRAEPGEFTKRAFLNDKLDLVQAEAIADLINSGTAQAARAALRSLSGAFSTSVGALAEQLIRLRMYVEAAIDFPEEEVDFLSDDALQRRLAECRSAFDILLQQATVGRVLRNGYRVVIVGKPNAGKSSLLNRLSGEEAAIVTEIAGTTRDILREQINIDGLAVELVDTAGLRANPDRIEEEGIRRAHEAMHSADAVLWLQDSNEPGDGEMDDSELDETVPSDVPTTVVRTKIDISGDEPGSPGDDPSVVNISVVSGQGIDALRERIRQLAGYHNLGEGAFTARRRHIDALQRAERHFAAGQNALQAARAGELLAEELRLAQQDLGEITGAVSSDDLLGRIFSEFCIGK
jgi:tRNA modification GTPase